jgi:hypothetical protein
VTPGARPLVVCGILVVAALALLAMPARSARQARMVAVGAVVAVLALLVSDLPAVFPGGQVEHSLGEFVPGVALVLRADPPGLMAALLAAAAALAALAEHPRTPMERAALLLCLAGSCVATMAGNAVLLFGGLELGNVAAMLLVVAAGPLGTRARAGVAVQHLCALGLLAATVQLQTGVGTTDLSAIPAYAVGWNVAWPWALAGAARLLASTGLPSAPGQRASCAWAAVAAAPTGLIVLLRLSAAAGDGGLPWLLSGLLVAAGLALGTGGAVEAMRRRAEPTAAGRALAVAAAGPVVAMTGVVTQPARLGMAAAGLALVLVLAAAPAWGGGGDEGSGGAAAWVRAVALAAAGGLPLGVGTTALVMSAGAALPQGRLGAAAGCGVAVTGLLTAVAGGAAARTVLAGAPLRRTGGRPRPDALLAVAAGAVLGLFPGLATAGVIDPLAAAGSAGAVDPGAVQGAGGGWAGGYLELAVLLAVVAALSASAVARGPAPALGPEPPVPPPLPASPVWDAWPGRLGRLGDRLVAGAGRGARTLTAVDRWLVTQPGLVAVLAGVAACLFIFR